MESVPEVMLSVCKNLGSIASLITRLRAVRMWFTALMWCWIHEAVRCSNDRGERGNRVAFWFQL